MSKIEVNQISSQCGSTLTIGQSGDTIQLACGATQTGFGRTGTVNWDTTAKTASFTAVSGNGYFVNTTSGAVTVTLPASPSAGDIVALQDYSGTWGTNNVTIGRNGSNIGGVAADPILSTSDQSITLVYVDATRGWQTVNDSTQTVAGAQYVTATGGTITCCGDFKIHTFTGPGTFCVSCAGNACGSNTVDYLVVAGGGGGGINRGGGGGAGGFRTNYPSPTGLTITATTYPITVGSGGAGIPGPGPSAPYSAGLGSPGSNSVFSTITSSGGGNGGASFSPNPQNPGQPAGSGGPGGSGGGAAGWDGNTGAGGSGNTPPVSPSQGNNGGAANPGPANGGGGGGGGHGAVGTAGSGQNGGPGGNGTSNSITGSSVTYSGGGGGAAWNGTIGTGGSGGGGNGAQTAACSPNTATAGTANTGGGGGAAGPDAVGSASGGSGIVIIRYKYQ